MLGNRIASALTRLAQAINAVDAKVSSSQNAPVISSADLVVQAGTQRLFSEPITLNNAWIEIHQGAIMREVK